MTRPYSNFLFFPQKVFITTLIIAAIPHTATAATATTTFAVTANVIAACSVTATPMAFGTYSPVSGTNLDQTSTINTTCTNTTSYTVGLNAGTFAGATVTTRRMTGITPANSLPYALYQDAARTTNWGNTPGTDTPAATIGNGAAQPKTVYGRIAASTPAAIDSYSDTITVTVNF